jgi:type I restriction enzyme, S subunit
MRWVEKSLDELGLVSRGRSRHRPRDAAHLYGGPYPFVQTGDVKHADLYLSSYSQTYSEVGLEQSKLWPQGTLCITIAANIAETSILGLDACFPDSIIGFVADDSKCDVRFIKYQFETIKQHYQQVSQGAAQDNLSLEKLLSFKLSIPPVEKQRRIADILSAYDDLIENNRRRMKLLEESARQLYQEWFVRLRFPGHEHTRIVDGLPEGWERMPMPEVVEINPTTRLSDEKEHWYVEMADLSADSMVIQNAVKRDGRSGSKFRNGDTLLARITPCLENGKTGYVDFLSNGEVGKGSTEFIVLRSKCVSPEFVYCLARTYQFRENAIKSMVGSSGRQRVQESCFEKFLVLLPPHLLVKLFREFTEPAFQQIKIFHSQNLKLQTGRNILLPRLMNGEITV